MVTADDLRIGGFTPFTTIDFPGKLAAVIFLAGCPWRCPYCHNPELQSFRGTNGLSWEQIRLLLEKRRGLLDAVVFSGGEPTAQPALAAALQHVRSMGFATGLHTGGAYPSRLGKVLPFVDWVGLDIKAPPDSRYDRLVRRRGAAGCFLRSLELIRISGVAFTLRTTVHPDCLSDQDLDDLQKWIHENRLPPTVIQKARAA